MIYLKIKDNILVEQVSWARSHEPGVMEFPDNALTDPGTGLPYPFPKYDANQGVFFNDPDAQSASDLADKKRQYAAIQNRLNRGGETIIDLLISKGVIVANDLPAGIKALYLARKALRTQIGNDDGT